MKQLFSILLLPLCLATAHAAEDIRRPYTGPSERGVDTSTLYGKVMCGYQGWFNCEGDGAGLGWVHWGRGHSEPPGPGRITVDLWPDMTELGPDERYPTDLRHEDGRVAEAYSSYNRATVLRHFDWMRTYGIDGVFVQRFANGVRDATMRAHKDTVLAHCREGANRTGRAYAVMYDLSGLPKGGVARVKDDWRGLRDEMHITEDPAYLHHKGKPVVTVWGIGFSDGRAYTLDECRDLVAFLKADGCTVMIGVPSFWREGRRDAVDDPLLHEIIAMADVVSPWTVGRYRTPEEAARHADETWRGDLARCAEQGNDFLPVVFPGFSWHNLKGDAPLGQIPRQKGAFLWSQFVAAKEVGAKMIYVAMFDEVDEGTAIFKCTNDPPTGNGVPFLDYEGLPSDHYLRLTGLGARLLRGEADSDAFPSAPAIR